MVKVLFRLCDGDGILDALGIGAGAGGRALGLDVRFMARDDGAIVEGEPDEEGGDQAEQRQHAPILQQGKGERHDCAPG